jgi:hypothetical protein
VLADFNGKGFRVFDRIHELEGRTHHRSPYRVPEIVRFLQKRGCRVRTADRGCQWVAVARSIGA